MCGIALILDKSGKTIQAGALDQLTDLVAHRGPDGRGTHIHENVGLGHRRLSILDLSDAGQQPMHFNDRYSLVFNGEIYNFIEIREQLRKQGYQFQSETDSEVILKAYDHYGIDCVHQFNGMWAFCLLDKQKKQLFCARDRFGIKPFYYSDTSDRLVIGSEIKQIIGFTGNAKINWPILTDYLVSSFEDYGTETFFKGVRQLLPGQYMLIDISAPHIEPRSYYFPRTDSTVQSLSQPEQLQEYKERLKASVKLRLRSDVQLGGCLSGGLDSSVITRLAAADYLSDSGKIYKAIHARSTLKNQDESMFARMAADASQAELNIIQPEISVYQEVMDEVIRIQDQPFGSMSMVLQYLLMKQAREIGNIVMLDGQGGDETMLGYERYYPAITGGFSPLQILRVSNNSKLSIPQVIAYNAYFRFSSIRKFRAKQQFGFLREEMLEQVNWDLFRQFANAYKDINQLQALELHSLQLPHLLRYEDRNSMAHGVEARLPLLDHNVVEAALAMDVENKLHDGWTKYGLRKMMEGELPDALIWRKNKFGFESPMEKLLNQIDLDSIYQNSPIIHKLCKKIPKAEKLPMKTRWKLYNIARWADLYQLED